ncbi:hypothetical protein PMIN06_008507 [Paraphaeosphaeria minitans]
MSCVGYGIVKSWVHLLAFVTCVFETELYAEAAASSFNKRIEEKDGTDREGSSIQTTHGSWYCVGDANVQFVNMRYVEEQDVECISKFVQRRSDTIGQIDQSSPPRIRFHC